MLRRGFYTFIYTFWIGTPKGDFFLTKLLRLFYGTFKLVTQEPLEQNRFIYVCHYLTSDRDTHSTYVSETFDEVVDDYLIFD